MKSLTPDKLRHKIDPDRLKFKTTAELDASTHIIGQPRGTRAIEFGVEMPNKGYNIFVLGETGTGRGTAIERFLKSHAAKGICPNDWIYVNNFSMPHEPRAIELEAGQAETFQTQMSKLVQDIQRELPLAFQTEIYQKEVTAVQKAFDAFRNLQLAQVDQKAGESGFGLIQTPKGYAVMPLVEGQPITPEQIGQLAPEERQRLEKIQIEISQLLTKAMQAIFEQEQHTREQLSKIDKEVAESAIKNHFDLLTADYNDKEELLLYIREVHQDILENINAIIRVSEKQPPVDLRRYEVNVLVDNKGKSGAPVLLETNPTFQQLFGHIEFEMINGALMTHFALIKKGSLHQANGGYLIFAANDLLKDGRAWEELKRSLMYSELRVPMPAQGDKGPVLARSISPEPIPLKVKIILLGSPGLYFFLHEQDQQFRDLFKVRADFDTEMDRSLETEQSYAQFIASRCAEEGLRHFDNTAVAKVIEYGIRLTDHQEKLSTRFGAIADLVREASFWASTFDREVVTAEDVQQALHERIYRANRIEERIYENMFNKTIFVETEGAVIGQVNGLSVLDTGEYAFGQPGRITASTFMGDDGIVSIERETEMSGPLHQKGVLTLTGYLGNMYAAAQPLSLSASLTFEQNYGGVDGDSASSTELYALLSSLSGVPIKQSIAVTGSVNQKGEIQPIGGVNEKIEGFFRLCQGRGLTGEHGVMIPQSNVVNLMLHEDVVTAVANKKFHIWPVATIDEGVEILTGMKAGQRDKNGRFPEGTLHHKVQTRLRQLAEDLSKFGDNSDDKNDEDEK